MPEKVSRDEFMKQLFIQIYQMMNPGVDTTNKDFDWLWNVARPFWVDILGPVATAAGFLEDHNV